MNEELVEALDQATVAHALWKARLIGAMEGDGTVFDRKSAGDCHACAFGKWLDGNRTLSGQHPEYERVSDRHERLHRLIGESIDKLASRRGHEVRESLGRQGELRIQ